MGILIYNISSNKEKSEILIETLCHIGARHSAEQAENQDVLCSGETDRYTVISLADGVSTCKEARAGAEIASRAVTELLLKKGHYFLEFDHEQIARGIISHILYELNRRAQTDSQDVREYSSTIASVLYDKKACRLLFFSLGDSLIAATDNGKFRIIAMPADSTDGCCVTTTKHAPLLAQANKIDTDTLDAVMICSDGAWKQMYLKNRLKPEVSEMLADRRMDALREYLVRQNGPDDYSFIFTDLHKRRKRALA